MDKRTNKRKKQSLTPTSSKSKKVKLEAVKTEPKQDDPGPSERVSKEAVSALPKGDIEALREDITVWLQEQQECEMMDISVLSESNLVDEEPEEEADLENVDVPISLRLANFTEDEIRRTYKYECEWRKCKFMSGTERKYFLHVEEHAEQALKTENKTYRCEWDLCDYSTESGYEYTGHVHYHAYHTQLKVHGASIHMLLKLPNCNYDSRMRNTITNREVTFRCDWEGCTERINMAKHFFHHVQCHVDDLRMPHRQRNTESYCRWSLCNRRKVLWRNKLLDHMKKHTSERVVACFNCGAQFLSRSKYVDHCQRQIDISQRKHRCEQCGGLYASLRLLKNHLEYHDQSYQCELCPLKYSSKGILANHVRERHLRLREFKCAHCERAFAAKKELMNHILAVHEKKVYRCEEFGCNVVYKSIGSLKRHYIWHYNLPQPVYACHLCDEGKQFKRQHDLTKHFRFKHDFTRSPGMPRFRYKPDADGLYRLQSFIEGTNAEKRDKPPQPASDDDSTQEASQKKTENAAPLKINSIKSIGVHQFLIELGFDPELCQLKEESESMASTSAAPVVENAASEVKSPEKKTTPKAARAERSTGRVKQVAKEEDGSGTEPAKKTKDVKDFMVMKRYLKSSEKVGVA